jgi:hypothetical protein
MKKNAVLLLTVACLLGLSGGFYLGYAPHHWRLVLGLPLPTVKILSQKEDLFSPEVIAAIFNMTGVIVAPTVTESFDDFLFLSNENDLFVADATWLRKITPLLSERPLESQALKKVSTDFLTDEVERASALPLFWKVEKKMDKYNFTIWAVGENKERLNDHVLEVLESLFNRSLNSYWLNKYDFSSCLKLAEDLKLPMNKKPSYLRDHFITNLR